MSEDSPYFSHHPQKIVGPRNVSFRNIKQKSGELQRKWVTVTHK
jgi:hypothetical protein